MWQALRETGDPEDIKTLRTLCLLLLKGKVASQYQDRAYRKQMRYTPRRVGVNRSELSPDARRLCDYLSAHQ